MGVLGSPNAQPFLLGLYFSNSPVHLVHTGAGARSRTLWAFLSDDPLGQLCVLVRVHFLYLMSANSRAQRYQVTFLWEMRSRIQEKLSKQRESLSLFSGEPEGPGAPTGLAEGLRPCSLSDLPLTLVNEHSSTLSACTLR